MGNRFQNLVAPDIPATRAQAEGDRLLAWLIAEQIVSSETRDCVLGAEAGHPPGLQYAEATGGADPYLLGSSCNGMSVIAKRTVFHSGQGGFELICSA